MVEHAIATAKIRVGELTENELYIVIDMLTKICEPLGITVSEPTKPRPMYRDVEIIGPWERVDQITALCQDCEVIYD